MKYWKFTYFDLFSLNMVIKGARVYKGLPEASVLQVSLDAVLQLYPQLLGRYDAKLNSAAWSGREKPIELVKLDRKGQSVSEDMYTLVPKYNTNRFKAGRSRAFEAYRIKLDDGVAIVLQGAYVLMDGATFYRIAGDWGLMTSGLPLRAQQAMLPDMINSGNLRPVSLCR